VESALDSARASEEPPAAQEGPEPAASPLPASPLPRSERFQASLTTWAQHLAALSTLWISGRVARPPVQWTLQDSLAFLHRFAVFVDIDQLFTVCAKYRSPLISQLYT
jgi:hypothetical protein